MACNGNGSRLPSGWNSVDTLVSIQCTVPDFMAQVQVGGCQSCSLKFSVMRNYFSIYGNVSREPDVYQLSLELSKVASLLVFLFLFDRMSEEEEEELLQVCGRL